jgi:predicted nucleic acid-binding Zn ribbon protein
MLAPAIEELGLSPDFRLEKLKKNWQSIVGTVNARNTHPLSLRDGVLDVAVSSPVWIVQARFYTSVFLKKINSFESEDGVDIREIHFTLERPHKE